MGDSVKLKMRDVHSLYYFKGEGSRKNQYVVFIKCFQGKAHIMMFLENWNQTAGMSSDCAQMEYFMSTRKLK